MSVTPAEIDLTIYQGSTFNETWTFYDDAAATVLTDWTGYTAAMKIRKDFGEPVLLTLTNGTPSSSVSAIALGGALGTVRIYITDEDTAALAHTGFTATTEPDGSITYTARYDLELTLAGETFREAMGVVTLSREVTA